VHRIAIICALEGEVRPLVRRPGWREWTAVRGAYRSYESSSAVVVCAGIGLAAAGRAAAAVIEVERPRWLVSAGFAGALTPWLKGGELVLPSLIVAAATGEKFPLGEGNGTAGEGAVLVTAEHIVGHDGKADLVRRFQAHAVDMEASAIAEAARAHGIGFSAVKAISDEFALALPDMSGLVDDRGRFRTARFVLRTALRPAKWVAVGRLASNRTRASQSLCRALLRLQEALPAACSGPRA
jgi:adenosylhomocysteine nucleosidase